MENLEEKLGKETVLVVDDFFPQLDIVKRILELESKYHIILADSGESALKILNSKEHKVNMVISDTDMPGMSGIELYHKIVENKDLSYLKDKFLLVSGNEQEEAVAEGINFIKKGYSVDEFIKRVESIAYGG